MRILVCVALAAVALAGCQMKPDIPSQRDIGFTRAERSGEVTAETQPGGPARDTTTAQSMHQRAAADQLASGKQGETAGPGTGG